MIQVLRNFAQMAVRGWAPPSIADLDRWMEYSAFGAPTTSGFQISETSALKLAPVWACVDLISKSGAIIPGHVYRRVTGGLRDRVREPKHYLYPIIHDLANPTLLAMEWRRLALVHLLTWGNHYSWIEWGADGRPKALWPVPPESVRASRKAISDPIEYEIKGADGQWKRFEPWEILHIRGMSLDGVTGLSPVGYLRESMGLVGAGQESAANLHKNGFTSRLVIKMGTQASPEQMKTARESFAAANGGKQNQHKAILLPAPMEAQAFTINPNDAQFIEQEKLNASRIYQIYGVPPHMVGDTEKSTSWGTGIEQQTIGFVTFTMLWWMDAIETWQSVKLLPDGQRDIFIEYDFKGLLRGDTAARGTWYDIMLKGGVYSPNHVLNSENEEPYEGGDVYQRPMNMTFVNSKGEIVLKTEKDPTPAPGGTNATEPKTTE